MKKTNLLPAILLALVAAFAASCATTSQTAGSQQTGGAGGALSAANSQSRFTMGEGGVPDFVQEAIARTAEDSIVGIGTSKLSRPQSAINAASDEARSDIASQLDASVSRLSKMYFAGSDLSPSEEQSFNESVTRTLSQNVLRKAKRIAMDTDATGAYWVVLEMLDGDQTVISTINDQAQKNSMANTRDNMNRLETQMDNLPAAQQNYPQYTIAAAQYPAQNPQQNQTGSAPNYNGQGQANPAPARQLPAFVKNAIKNTPEDCFIAFSSSNLRSTSGAMNAAALNARTELARTMETTIQAFARSYSKGNELDFEAQVSLDESFVRDLVNTKIRNAQILDADFDQSGAFWVVYIMPKEQTRDIANAVNAELAAKKLAGPAAMADDAEKRLEELIKAENGYYGLIESNQNLQAQNQNLQDQLAAARKDLANTNQRITQLENQVKTAENKLSTAELNAVHQAELAAVKADQAVRRAEEQQQALNALQAELARKQTQTQADKDALSQAQIQLERARDDAAAARRQADTTRSQLTQAQGEAYRLNLDLTEARNQAAVGQLMLMLIQRDMERGGVSLDVSANASYSSSANR